jgi:hypothetical protein
LVVVERLKNELVEIFNVDGSAAGIAGAMFNGMFGQGVSWRTGARRVAARAAHVMTIGDTSGGLARG